MTDDYAPWQKVVFGAIWFATFVGLAVLFHGPESWPAAVGIAAFMSLWVAGIIVGLVLFAALPLSLVVATATTLVERWRRRHALHGA